MLKSILIAFLFFSSLSYGQIPGPPTSPWWTFVREKPDTVYFPPLITFDTLVIDPRQTNIKFIKLGDKLYSINKGAPYLEEVKPVFPGWKIDSLIKELHPDSVWTNTCCAPEREAPVYWTGISWARVIPGKPQLDTEEVCRNISDPKRAYGAPWPAILYKVTEDDCHDCLIGYLDSKKHPSRPWIRVWENN